MAVDNATSRVAVFKNGVAAGWLDGTLPAATLHPALEVLAGGYTLDDLTPISGQVFVSSDSAQQLVLFVRFGSMR